MSADDTLKSCQCPMCRAVWAQPLADIIADAVQSQSGDAERMTDTYPIHRYKLGHELLRKINVGLADRRFTDAERLAWSVEMLTANERLWK